MLLNIQAAAPAGRAWLVDLPAPDRTVHTEICLNSSRVLVSRFSPGAGPAAFFHS